MLSLYNYNRKYSLMPLISGMAKKRAERVIAPKVVKPSRAEIVDAIIKEYYTGRNGEMIYNVGDYQNGTVIVNGFRYGFTFSLQAPCTLADEDDLEWQCEDQKEYDKKFEAIEDDLCDRFFDRLENYATIFEL